MTKFYLQITLSFHEMFNLLTIMNSWFGPEETYHIYRGEASSSDFQINKIFHKNKISPTQSCYRFPYFEQLTHKTFLIRLVSWINRG